MEMAGGKIITEEEQMLLPPIHFRFDFYDNVVGSFDNNNMILPELDNLEKSFETLVEPCDDAQLVSDDESDSGGMDDDDADKKQEHEAFDDARTAETIGAVDVYKMLQAAKENWKNRLEETFISSRTVNTNQIVAKRRNMSKHTTETFHPTYNEDTQKEFELQYDLHNMRKASETEDHVVAILANY
jgi:hypothetical protein